MSKSFQERRRQTFLTESFAEAAIKYCIDGLALFNSKIAAPDQDAERQSLLAASIADFEYQKFSVRYTAGESVEVMRIELAKVIGAYEKFQKALATYEGIPRITPFSFRELGHYERCMQLIGLCYLLHRRDLLPRIAALQDPGYAGKDTLYEDLLSYELDNRFDVDALHWQEPYERLVEAMYVESDEDSARLVKTYVQRWYPAFKTVPWHDGHMRISDTEGDYFGYWAFEAGAVAYLLDLDDSAIDHMVYPRDLVAWARANKHVPEAEQREAERRQPKRCPAGQPCPREGYWFTPAAFGAGPRFFEHGEIMPEIKSDYGSTIWQWSLSQSEPPH